MQRILLEVTPELAAALDVASGTESRNAFIESELWKSKTVKAAAAKGRIVRQPRPLPGKWTRKKKGKK
jgi:hypothetical protein